MEAGEGQLEAVVVQELLVAVALGVPEAVQDVHQGGLFVMKL